MRKPIFANIASFNRLEVLHECVTSFLNTVPEHLAELNIVDDYSDKPVRDYLKELKVKHPSVAIYLLNEWVPGVSRVLNFALGRRHETQDWVSMDNDVVFQTSDWLTKMMKVADHPDVGIVALKPCNVDFNGEVFPRHPELPLELTHAIPNLTTYIKRDVINELGFYHEYPWTGFDWDIAIRANKLGYLTGLYCTSRTNPDDYIDALDLGRPNYYNDDRKVEYGKEKYSEEVMNYIRKADTDSNKEMYERIPLIQSGNIDLQEESSMGDFRNYEEL